MSYPKSIFEKFGGIRAAARSTGYSVSTIASWIARGAIPDRYKPHLLQIAKDIGLGLTEVDFFPSPQYGGASDCSQDENSTPSGLSQAAR